MCSMEYEMLVSHSPPIFSHTPPGGFLTDYAMRINADTLPRAALGTCRSLHHSNSFTAPPKSFVKPPASPKRPCLVIRPSDDSLSSSDEDPTSPTKLKKRVVFADDKGMSLTHVRVMTEPSNVPPFWSHKFLAEVTQGVNADPLGDRESWEVTFPQPASDYLHFRKRLDVEKVSLENVIVREAEQTVVGTVKVSNLSFHKRVVIRASVDAWETHQDTVCSYVPNNIGFNVSVLYDTFSFKISLSPQAKALEFCVLFECDGREYWDNNHQKNYVLVKKMVAAPLHKALAGDALNENSRGRQVMGTCTDAVRAKMDSWSEFASWTHLENSNPYW